MIFCAVRSGESGEAGISQERGRRGNERRGGIYIFIIYLTKSRRLRTRQPTARLNFEEENILAKLCFGACIRRTHVDRLSNAFKRTKSVLHLYSATFFG